MDNYKNIVIAALVAGFLTATAFWVVRPENTVVNEILKEKESTGALSGPDIPYSYLRFGSSDGLRFSPTNRPLTTATTTVCAIQSPAATSTLVLGGIQFDVSTTTATTVHMAKAATAFATTTSLGQAVLAANERATLTASTTFSTEPQDQTNVFGPSQWFVVGLQGGVGTFSPTGQCFANFAEYNLE